MEEKININISNHDFQQAKEQLKQFAEQDVEKLKFDTVATQDKVLGIDFEHLVNGKEFNNLIEQIQAYISHFYDKQQTLIKEFGEVYKALEALDKGYLQAILTSVEAINKTNKKILIEQERIDTVVEKQQKTLLALKNFRDDISHQSLSESEKELGTLIDGLENRLTMLETRISTPNQKDFTSQITILEKDLHYSKVKLQDLSNKMSFVYVLSGLSVGISIVVLLFTLLR